MVIGQGTAYLPSRTFFVWTRIPGTPRILREEEDIKPRLARIIPFAVALVVLTIVDPHETRRTEVPPGDARLDRAALTAPFGARTTRVKNSKFTIKRLSEASLDTSDGVTFGIHLLGLEGEVTGQFDAGGKKLVPATGTIE